MFPGSATSAAGVSLSAEPSTDAEGSRAPLCSPARPRSPRPGLRLRRRRRRGRSAPDSSFAEARPCCDRLVERSLLSPLREAPSSPPRLRRRRRRLPDPSCPPVSVAALCEPTSRPRLSFRPFVSAEPRSADDSLPVPLPRIFPINFLIIALARRPSALALVRTRVPGLSLNRTLRVHRRPQKVTCVSAGPGCQRLL